MKQKSSYNLKLFTLSEGNEIILTSLFSIISFLFETKLMGKLSVKSLLILFISSTDESILIPVTIAPVLPFQISDDNAFHGVYLTMMFSVIPNALAFKIDSLFLVSSKFTK